MKKRLTIIYLLSLSVLFAANYKGLPANVAELCQNITQTPQDKHIGVIAKWKKQNPLVPVITSNTVTFLYFSEKEETPASVAIAGTFNNFSEKTKMIQVGNSHLFYKQIKIKKGEPIRYYFAVQRDGNSKRERDYFNRAIIYDKESYNTVVLSENSNGVINIWGNVETGSDLIPRRNILVYLPPHYYTEPERRYPVVYMHDGQQVFDSPAAAHGGWKMDTIADRLINEGKIEPIIIVGVYNSSKRDDELMGWSTFHQNNQTFVKAVSDEKALVSKRGEAYEKYIIDVIKPLVDSKYRTKPDGSHTGIGGASSGAMEALYLGFKYPQIFSKIAALSGGFEYYDDLVKEFMIPPGKLTIYLDCGDSDLDKQLLPATIRMHQALMKAGYKEGNDLVYREIVKAGHNEIAWSQRVADFLQFLFPVESGK